MPKMKTGITCTAEQMVTAEMRYECITRSFLIDECRFTEFFSGYIVNVKHVRSTSPDMMLVDQERYRSLSWHYFQDGDRFNSCQVIYSQFGLAIHQNDHQARSRFVERAQNEIAVVPDFHKRILFSDEANFWLNGYVNKQNCRIWSEANPQVYVETPLHPEKLTVWCALGWCF
ncbi:hypothetical protein TNCV_2156821 [Trichonephila clavipes]|nr:hypothetical protein TNCV_2156821 [Trichonephila clavipes]